MGLFFFQAEDGIRDLTVTGVQTCALPISLLSLQPQLVSAYEAWRHCLPRANAWFVSVEQGSLAAARLGRHGWDRVHGVRIGADWLRELKRLQTFGRLASNSPEEGQVYVDAPQAWREVAGGTAQAADTGGLQWLGEPQGPPTPLQPPWRTRRPAPSAAPSPAPAS